MTNRLIFAATLAAGFLTALTPANAQQTAQQPPAQGQPSPIAAAVNLADLRALVTGLGHQIVEVRQASAQNPSPAVLGRTPEGLAYQLEGRVCDQNANCTSMMISTAYRGAANVSDANLAIANARFAAVRAEVDRANDLFRFSRYVILNGGVTAANVATNISVFLSAEPASRAIAQGQRQ